MSNINKTWSPLISVIVPIYNAEKYLCECVDSILAQTYENIEVILVDDGSIDSSPQICDEYAKKDARISVLHQENSGDDIIPRFVGLEVAKAELISFVDADDVLLPEMLEKLHMKMQETNADIIACATLFANETLTRSFCASAAYLEEQGEDIIRAYLHGNIQGHMWGRLFKREMLENIDVDKSKKILLHDDITMLRVYAKCGKFVRISEALYVYRQIENSAFHSAMNKERAELVFKYFEELHVFVRENFLMLSSAKKEAGLLLWFIDELGNASFEGRDEALLEARKRLRKAVKETGLHEFSRGMRLRIVASLHSILLLKMSLSIYRELRWLKAQRNLSLYEKRT